MSLDPVMKAFLDQMAMQPGPKMWEMGAPEARQVFAALMQLAGPQNIPVGSVTNAVAKGPAGEIPIRNYAPVGAASGPLPTLVFYHGGGFVIGDLDTHDGLCRLFAKEAGIRVIAVNYRLAPEHKFPAAVEDACAALEWIVAHAADLGVDKARLAVGGDSAGGGLTAAVTQIAKRNAGPKIAFQLLLFPVTHIGSDTRSMRDCAQGMFLEKATLDWFFGHYLGNRADSRDVRASPLLAADFAGLPPAYLMTADCDPLHDEGLAYADKLRSAGVPVMVADHPGLVHDFIYLYAVLPQAGEAIRAASASLKAALAA